MYRSNILTTLMSSVLRRIVTSLTEYEWYFNIDTTDWIGIISEKSIWIQLIVVKISNALFFQISWLYPIFYTETAELSLVTSIDQTK